MLSEFYCCNIYHLTCTMCLHPQHPQTASATSTSTSFVFQLVQKLSDYERRNWSDSKSLAEAKRTFLKAFKDNEINMSPEVLHVQCLYCLSISPSFRLYNYSTQVLESGGRSYISLASDMSNGLNLAQSLAPTLPI